MQEMTQLKMREGYIHIIYQTQVQAFYCKHHETR